MAVNTRFNVKVPLNVSGSEIPGADHLVYWDNASGSFELTRSFEGGGGGGGDQNLQSVTNFGKSSSLGGLFLFGQNLDWGDQTGIDATSGFRTSSNAAYSHVTPQLRKTAQLVLTIPARRTGDGYVPVPYPDNYITYGGVRLGNIGSDGGGDEDDQAKICTPKWDNDTIGASFTFSGVSVGNVISVAYNIIAEFVPSVGDEFILSGFDNPDYQVEITCASVSFAGDVTFDVDSVTVPSGLQEIQRSFCLATKTRKSNRLVVEGQSFAAGGSNKSGTGIIELRGNSGSGQDAGRDGGMLLSSAGNIYFFNATTSSVSGSLIPISASAQISLKSDNSLHFATKNPLSSPTSESFKDVLVISSSGTEPRISVGFNPNEIPEKPFEIKTDKDDATGTELVLEGSRKSTPYVAGDELGKLSFLAASASFSGSERFTKGEGAVIRSTVSNQSKFGIKGELTFAIADNAELEPTASFKMQINGGVNDIGANQGINLVQSGSLVLQDRISGSTREKAGLFIGDASGSQTFRVTNLGSNTSYDDAELVLTGSAKISGPVNFSSSLHISSSGDAYFSRESKIFFFGNSGHQYGQIGIIPSGSGLTPDSQGGDSIYVNAGGSTGATMRLYNVSGAVFFEQSHINASLARNFRIEGATDSQLFFTSGGIDRVGIGTRTPSSKLEVSGDITTTTVSTVETTLGSDATTNVDTFVSTSYNSAIYDYTLRDVGVGARVGQFMVCVDEAGAITFTDTSTNHLTDTTPPEITADLDGSTVRVRVTNGNGYTFKAFAKKL